MSKTRELRNFDFGNATDTGQVRQHNEDYMGYFECINGHVFIVCDGMGGHAGGSAASRMAVENIRAYLENHYFDLPEDALKAAIEYANGMIYRKSRENPELAGMGTTIVMVIIRNDKAYYAHVGDSRIYLFTSGVLHRLTRDHSHVQNLVDEGTISDEEAETHPRRNEITRALGISPSIAVESCLSPLHPANDDILLLCSDGLTSMIRDSRIAEVLAENISVQHKALKLTQMANDMGGADNITLQLVWFFNLANRKTRFQLPDAKKKSPAAVAFPVRHVKSEKAQEPVIQEQELPVEENSETPLRQPLTGTGWLEKIGQRFNLSLPVMKKIRTGLIIAGFLLLAYIIWDLFIRQGATSRMSSPVVASDTLKNGGKDTAGAGNSETVNAPPARPDTVWISYNVKKGEVLGKISDKFHLRVDFIKQKNGLKNDNIRENQKLQIPVKASHNVQENETADQIASKYGVKKEQILKANDIKDPSGIRKGRDLIIPF